MELDLFKLYISFFVDTLLQQDTAFVTKRMTRKKPFCVGYHMTLRTRYLSPIKYISMQEIKAKPR